MSNGVDFWKAYALAYNDVIGNYSRHRKLVEMHAKALKDCRIILDSGSGPGHLAKSLLENNHAVYALDINPAALELLKQKCGKNSNLTTVCADANKLPFKDGFFDGVSSMLVLWAIENPEQYLLEHKRVLKQNGILVLSGPGPETRESVGYQLEMLKKDLEGQGLFPKIQESWNAFLQYTSQNISHTGENWFSNDEIRKLFEDNGFAIESITPNPVYCEQGHVAIAMKV